MSNPTAGEHEPASRRLPDFLIVGAMRSGTTSLYRYLGAHPEIAMAPKELQFFTLHFDQGEDWYRTQFPTHGSTQLCGEATADYLARASAMRRIAQFAPHARLVATLRNPVARAWSHYLLRAERGHEDRSFSTVVDEELAAIDEAGASAEGVFYLAHGMYDVHVQRCLELFPPEKLHVSIFEQMAHDPMSSYRRVCKFLGVDAAFIPENLGAPVNPYVTFRSLPVRRLTHKLPDRLARVVGRLNTRRSQPAPAMERPVRERLDRYYQPHVARLEQLLGHPVEEWQI